MKSFISFTNNSLGLFYAPKKTIDELCHYYKSSVFSLGLLVSMFAMFSHAVGQGVQNGWAVPTVFASLVAGYLAAFMGGSLILGVMSFFKQTIVSKEFWGIYLVSDFPLIIALPLILIAQVDGLSFFRYLVFIAYGWSVLLKLFMIQRFLKASFAKAVILWIAPILFLIAWGANIAIVWADQISQLF